MTWDGAGNTGWAEGLKGASLFFLAINAGMLLDCEW